jgi:DNA primase
MEFFHWNLLENSAGKKALSYLSKRGTPKEIIHRFKLGFAQERWDGLTNYFLKKRIPTGILEKSGLIIGRKTKNGFYDRFRGRIVFPIFDVSAQVIGFGGRVMDDSLPKYLNSPETLVYNKGRSLYGVHQAKNRCREKASVYIVEGYFDLLALHQHGIENSVATLGTALSKEHVRFLKGLVGTDGKVTLVFDSDEAGIKAAQRCIEIFDKEYVNAQIIVLPSGHDPDSYLLEFAVVSYMSTGRLSFDMVRPVRDQYMTGHWA